MNQQSKFIVSKSAISKQGANMPYFNTCEETKLPNYQPRGKNTVLLMLAGSLTLSNPQESFSRSTNISFRENKGTCEDFYDNYCNTIEKPFTECISEWTNISKKVNELDKKILNKKSIIASILSLRGLINNWDGYGAVPIIADTAANAIILIDLIGEDIFGTLDNFFPNSHGTLTFIWKSEKNNILELEVGIDTISYYVERVNKKTEYFDQIDINVEQTKKIAEFIESL